jgi:hypothetical protein
LAPNPTTRWIGTIPSLSIDALAWAACTSVPFGRLSIGRSRDEVKEVANSFNAGRQPQALDVCPACIVGSPRGGAAPPGSTAVLHFMVCRLVTPATL